MNWFTFLTRMHMIRIKLLFSLLLSTFLYFITGTATAQMVGANAYIKATSVEIGINGAGGFEGVNTGVSPVLAGMHPRTNTAFFGFVANPQLNGWAGSAFDGDFFTPGTPENGWGIEVGGTNYANNCNLAQDIPGAITSWLHTYNCYTSDWEGNIANLHVKVNYFLQETDLYYTTTVSITNNTGAMIPEMFYYRNLDPDNNIMINGSVYDTQNSIENQPSGSCGIAHVSATQTNPWNSYLGLAAIGPNWRADYGGFNNRDASDLWNGVGFTQTIGASVYADEAIALAYRIQNLAPGATETFKFVVILAASQAGNAINNLLYLSYPGSVSAPPPMCTPYNDTVRICAGVPTTISVQGSIVNEFNWNWSPATGLSTTTGPSSNASPTATTTYTLTGTPLSACVAPVTMTFVVQTTPSVNMNPVADVTTCAGATVPASSFSSTPAGATFSWTNSNPAIGLAASGTGNVPSFTAINGTGSPVTATITVTPTVPGGCSGPPLTYTITVNAGLTIGVNSATICPSQTATLTATGGTTYLWNTGSSANPLMVSPTATTSYTVTGTTGSCTGTAVATVTIGGSITVTVNSATICPGDTAVLIPTGGTSYSWDTGSSANPLTVSPAATTSYTVTGTNGGCSGTAVATVTVNPTPTVTVPANIAVCNGGTVAAGTFTSTPAGATFAWTNSDPSIGLAASGITSVPSFTAVNTGTTPVTATITVTATLAGCPGTPNTYTITVNPTPAAPTAPGTSTCVNTTTTLTATAPGGTYQWYDAASGGALLQTGASYTTPAVTAAVNYFVQTTSADGCVSAMTTVPVTIAPGLAVNAGPDDTICFGGSTTLNASPNGAGYSYSWNAAPGLGSTTAYNPTASPSVTTTYVVTITSPAGCVGTDSVTVFANPRITIAKTAFNVTCNGACNGQAIVIPAGGAGGYTYSWTNGDTTASITGLCPGSFTVTVTDAWGCTAATDTSVTEPAALAATMAQTSTSCNAVCDGTATITVSGGTPGGGYSYSWNTTPAQTTSTVTGLCAGVYICTATDANSCSISDTVTITEPSPVVIAPVADDTICNSGSTIITAIASGGNGAPYSYVWTMAAGLSNDTISNPSAAPASTTTYTVNATDVNGCPAVPETTTITVNPPLAVVAAGTASICPAASAPISAIGSGGNNSGYTYSWLPATGLDNAAIATPVASPPVTTTYTVTVNDGCSPSVTATVTVTVLPLPSPAITSNVTSGCVPLCVNFVDQSTIAAPSSITGWNWSFGDASADAPVQNGTHCFQAPGAYAITMTATSASGCVMSQTFNNYIIVYPNPDAEATAPVSTSIITPNVPFTDLSTDAAAWSWDFNDSYATGSDNVSSQQNPVHTYSEVGTYTVGLIVTSIHGCSDTTDITVVIDPEFTFYIPNAFSPNGDGVNDEFSGKGDFFTDYEMSIFDRWGNLIFFTDDISKPWLGLANNGSEIAQQDVYVYVVKLTDNKQKKHKFIGSVTLVK